MSLPAVLFSPRGSVAQNILFALGSTRFLAMTGSHSFSSSPACLTFRLLRNMSSATHMRISLATDDTYLVEALYCSKRVPCGRLVALVPGVHAGDLARVFTSITGMATCL